MPSTAFCFILCVLPGVVARQGTTPASHQASSTHSKKAVRNAGKLFADRCVACHSVPNPKLATDLAWLDQVNRTT